MNKRLALPIIAAVLAVSACNSPVNAPNENKAATISKALADAESDSDTGSKKNPTISTLDDDTLVIINGQAITKTMYALYFQDRTKTMKGDKQSPDIQMKVLNELANVILITQDAEANRLPEEPNIAVALMLSRSTLLAQAGVQHHISNNAPKDEDVSALYETRYGAGTAQEFKARHILLEQEDAAKEIIEQLNKGADFAALAKENSTGPSANTGGDLGWFESDSMVPAFAKAIQAMEAGSFSNSPVQTQYGWHVILLEERRDTPKLPLAKVREQLKSELQRTVMARYIEGLRSKAEIVFNDKMAKKKLPAEDQSAH
ncbi:MAG: peptidylprolyl isomerase [Candidatus Polarisedimenticolaceae bacterium]|nr:peptidylprolyl isomerase [Candidatus Polarisedimenticolaceae bacterium]